MIDILNCSSKHLKIVENGKLGSIEKKKIKKKKFFCNIKLKKYTMRQRLERANFMTKRLLALKNFQEPQSVCVCM